jgi:hypothetical protein
MKKLFMLLQILVRRESELSDGAIREGAVERSVVTIDVLVARKGVFETFVKVETCWAGAFEVFVAVEDSDFFSGGRGRKGFENGAISEQGFAEGLDAYFFSGFGTFDVVLVDVVPDIDKICVEWVGFE